jgi:hypothetical protein
MAQTDNGTSGDARELDALAETAARLTETGARYENALLWVRHLALLHYLGEAFDPEHMRTVANIAANALADDRFRVEALPDYEETSRAAQAEAERLSAVFAAAIDKPDDADDADDEGAG